MIPAGARAAESGASDSPRRFVALCATLGFHTPFLFPAETGAGYTLTPYLEPLRDLRGDFTVISGLQHTEQTGPNGHASEMTWLTSAKNPGLAGFRNTISLDQFMAERIGNRTRFPSLILGTRGDTLSWSANGVPLPAERSPARAFQQLFVEGSPSEIESQVRSLSRGRSVLDTVSAQARALEGRLGPRDREKLDEYFTAVRELESRLVQNEEWLKRPKPKVDAPPLTDARSRTDAIGKMKLMQELLVLALQTDSTRLATLNLGGMNAVPDIAGVRNDWHNLSHHGKDPAKIEELRIIELAEFEAFAGFLARLKAVEENGRPLLDSTTVLFGSNLGNASSHSAVNLPIILAGGSRKHGRHLAVDPKKHVFSNLFIGIAQHLGIEAGAFGWSTGVLDIDQA